MAESLIPTQPRKLGRDPATARILLLGRPKAGKSTTAASAPGTLVIATEIGYETISGIFPVYVDSWKKFLAVIEQLADRPDMKRVVIDTFTKLARLAETEACRILGVDHPSEKGYGVGAGRVKSLLIGAMDRLLSLRRQIVLIAHTTDATIKVRDSEKEKSQIRMNLPSGARDYAVAEVDAILYLTIEENPATLEMERVIHFKSATDMEIGGRYLPDADIPNYMRLPQLPTPSWPVIEAILRKGFVPQETPDSPPQATPDNGSSAALAPKKRFVRKTPTVA